MTSSSGGISPAVLDGSEAGFLVVDAHTAGEPLRIFVRGTRDLPLPEPPGATMLQKRAWARREADDLRRLTMLEPRGHADMYGCWLTEPVTEDGDAGVLFLHNEGFSTMCGHGVIGVVQIGLELGLLAPAVPDLVRLDTPAGRVTATAHRHPDDPQRIDRVTFVNVPSFVAAADRSVQVPGLGRVDYDLAFGGAYYAVVSAASVGLELHARAAERCIDLGRRIKAALAPTLEPADYGPPALAPENADLAFLYGVIFVAEAQDPNHHSRNVCVFADGEVDRSPTGTGVSARAALLHARGELQLQDEVEIESILGTTFTVRVIDTSRVGDLPAVIPEVGGRAWLTGVQRLFRRADDPLGGGFLLR